MDQLPRTPSPTDITVPESRVRTIVVVRWGLLLWAVALLVVLLVPELRSEGRQWWVWVPVAGLVGGALGHVYLARGRGNAEMA
ncbi:hypothetical protein BJF81_12130 [Ornithinimicrobium sp. CNJ-824]|uniref:DUF2530 domain-containing protein n=1 Tax=Ornithinimicrobium sp. CNJ-824 TaxID=1904966 RepID=UPI0009662444|nr:DUF2530 domain-containing protein [Ornithinimicrobium sp. CNJ-824]OLT22979.1 hypothetical protein BJF81_12130 [Ornithinimicrobium sp. CNJ-824]